MDSNREQLRSWLRRVLAETNLTATAVARKSGVAQTTITRFLSNDDGPIISNRTVAKIENATGIFVSNMPSTAHAGFGEVEGVPYTVEDDASTPINKAIAALIDGRPAADPWILKTRAIEGAGYGFDDIAIVDLNAKPAAGDAVCAQVYSWSEGRADTIFRLYEPPFLVSTSAAKQFRKPHLVDGDRVIIKGVLTECIKLRR